MSSQAIEQDQDFSWYVLRVISGQEKKVKSYLDNEVVYLKYQDLVRQILVPSERAYEIKKGKKQIKERSYLPGYVILHANLSDPEVIHALAQVTGVIGFLGSAEKSQRKPIPLRKSEVNRLLGKMDEIEENAPQLEQLFVHEENVKIIDGPFSGFTGSVEEINEEKHKLRIMVRIFDRNTPIDLNFYQVEKLG